MTGRAERAEEPDLDLPVLPPVAPMLAKPVKTIPPQDGGLFYEPKWDGFRCVLFRDGDRVYLGSRNERPFTRYFPELIEAIKTELPGRCVLDGEIVLRQGQQLDFELLQQRIHPAASRVAMLAETHPASFIAFDLLALGDESLLETPFAERRARLERLFPAEPDPTRSIRLTPVTANDERAAEWFEMFEGAGLDGIIVKPGDQPYAPGRRTMFKVKHDRTADVVVCGYREHKSGPVVGSILLGLHSADGRLHHVGVVASFPMARRAELVAELAPYRIELSEHPWGAWAAQIFPGAEDSAARGGQRMPRGGSRWNAKKDLSFVPLRPELVMEVAYDQLEGDRFRHTAQFRRWRPDRTPESCTYEQLEQPLGYQLDDILAR